MYIQPPFQGASHRSSWVPIRGAGGALMRSVKGLVGVVLGGHAPVALLATQCDESGGIL